MRVATVVNFCTNEARFLRPVLEEAARFSKQILVPVCDHFFDGRPENRSLLGSIYCAFPQVTFVEYPYFSVPQRVFRTITKAHFWHSLSRLVACDHLEEGIEGVLFLDADEVPDGERVARWLEGSEARHHTVMRLANYWYFREPQYQADAWEDSIVFARVKALTPDALLHNDERGAIYSLLPGPKKRNVPGIDGRPLFHHFSWVRTREEMLAKVRAWGHRNDRNWESLVEEEFQTPFRGVDFVHGYKFQTVKPPVSIPMGEISFVAAPGKPRVIRVEQRAVLKQIRKAFPVWDRMLMTLDLNRTFQR